MNESADSSDFLRKLDHELSEQSQVHKHDEQPHIRNKRNMKQLNAQTLERM
jgi:hypothetical protein